MRTEASLGWRALPECQVCGTPTARGAFDRNGGACTECVGLLPELATATGPDQLDMAEWQGLVARRGAVERAKAAERDRKRRERRARRA